MAFNRPARTFVPANSGAAANQAVGYLNIGFKNQKGGSSRVGATGIALRAGNPREARLAEACMKDKEAMVKWMLENIEITFNPAQQSEDSDFAF